MITKTRIGILMAEFAPLHLGHLTDINYAAGQVDTLHLIITPSQNSYKTPTLQDVTRWLQNSCQAFGFIKIHHVDGLALPKFDAYFDYTKDTKGQDSLNAVIQALELDAPVVFHKTAKTPHAVLPATSYDLLPIKEQPLRYFACLAPACRYFYTHTLAVVGGESSGKTTLVHKLKNHYGATVALEMGRLYSDSHLGGSELALQYSDYTPIATLHAHAIDTARLSATAAVTLVDTDFVTTQAFCETYEGRSNPVVEAYIKDYRLDSTLYLDNNVKWVADGTRRLGGSHRTAFAEKLLSLYEKYDIDLYKIDHPDYHIRYEQAVAYIDELLGLTPLEYVS